MPIDRIKFIKDANDRFKRSKEFWGNWRNDARDSYAFVAGEQWEQEDVAVLDEEGRPAITFNYSEKMIDAVAGAEVSARQETHYAPREVGDSGLADVLNSAAKYVRDNCNAEDEESDAFRDMLVCGIGWTWTRITYERDLDGEVLIERVDPLEMYPDPAAIKSGLVDRRWNDRVWWVNEDDARAQWPDAIFPRDDEDRGTGVIRQGNRYNDIDLEDDQERHRGQVQLRLHEMYQLETVYRVATQDGGIQEVSEEDFQKGVKQFGKPEEGSYVKQKRRVYYRAYFAGETLLELKKSPCQEGFCFNCITGKRDRNKGTWYGLTRVMKDPQRWANKWLSQVLYIINSNAKGGLLAETGAFVDPTRAKEEWASPDSIVQLNQGGLDKVREKQQSPYPSGLDKLMTFALDSLPMVTGINLEALGLANREQAGVLEQQRKQAAYGLLSPIFDSLRRYRKEQGRVLLYYIQNYISDGRMIRIGGPESQQYIPLMKAPGMARYDIIVDQSPNSPDAKQKTWETLTAILPPMMKAGIPIPPDMLDYTPLPTSLTAKWKEFVGQKEQVDQKMQEQMSQLQQENASLKQNQDVKLQELMQKRDAMEAELAMKAHFQEEEIKLERAKALADFDLERQKQEHQIALQTRQAEHDRSMQKQDADNSFKLKAFTSGVNPDEAGKFTVDMETGNLEELLKQFSTLSQSIMEQAQQSNQATAQALAGLQQALSRPRQLIFDSAGRPVGSQLQ